MHTHQLKAEVADSVQDTKKMRLILDFADKDTVLLSRLEGEPLKGRGQVFGEPTLDRYAVPHSRHVHSHDSVR
ncbi:MAG TPA: hypothetical protein VEJ84_13290 [Acidimicrobiales bacterium]|nr:hypothetical protein [Acidimicrobiales bacterium]